MQFSAKVSCVLLPYNCPIHINSQPFPFTNLFNFYCIAHHHHRHPVCLERPCLALTVQFSWHEASDLYGCRDLYRNGSLCCSGCTWACYQLVLSSDGSFEWNAFPSAACLRACLSLVSPLWWPLPCSCLHKSQLIVMKFVIFSHTDH